MDDAQRTSTWRDKYKVHPFADDFPMMSDKELDALGANIVANGLKQPITFWDADKGTPRSQRLLVDGRNRMEAMERVGLDLDRIRSIHRGQYSGKEHKKFIDGDPVAYILSANVHRRHLTKQQVADFIIAAHRATPVSRQDGGKLAEGRPVNQVKAAAVATAKAMPKGPSKRTVERALAKAEGKTRKPSSRGARKLSAEEIAARDAAEAEGKTPATMPKYTARPMPKPKSGKPVVGIDAVRQCYLDRCAEPDVDLDAEQAIIVEALRAIDSKRALNGGKSQSRASALPQDDCSEDGPL